MQITTVDTHNLKLAISAADVYNYMQIAVHVRNYSKYRALNRTLSENINTRIIFQR